MARIRNGILGGFSGKVGEVIGQTYQGVSTMRAMPKYVINPKTKAQEEHRARVALLGEFLRPLAQVTNLSTWGGNAVNNSYNKAFAANLSNIVIDNGVAKFSDVGYIQLGDYWGEPFPDMQANFKFTLDEALVNCSLTWSTGNFSPWCFDTDRPILFIIQQLPNDVYSVVYADLLDCQRDMGSYEFQIDFPLATTIGGTFFYTFGYTIYRTPVEQPSNNLKAINWEEYYNKLANRYQNSGGHVPIPPWGGGGGGGGGHTFRIPAHNIPAFKPARSFVDDVRGNN